MKQKQELVNQFQRDPVSTVSQALESDKIHDLNHALLSLANTIYQGSQNQKSINENEADRLYHRIRRIQKSLSSLDRALFVVASRIEQCLALQKSREMELGNKLE